MNLLDIDQSLSSDESGTSRAIIGSQLRSFICLERNNLTRFAGVSVRMRNLLVEDLAQPVN